MVLSPHEVLREATEEWAIRWSDALACDVHLGDGGLPVELVARIQRPDGSDAPGATGAARDYVHISARVGEDQRWRSLGHELGHLLGGDHTESHGVLSGEEGRSNAIDTEAAVSVCTRLPCGAMSPEAP